ncbi:MAG: DUF1674 domain-containing protein [Sphingomonadaceae bacterium]|nr:DUF1674 domain-containing protein [Thermaurantiacus sp.]MCS6985981.1 DUF1674 domain-containing protein [Sphingomonadaceae bacterium]MDW8414803.1 DUF1674 domain-containing protein [Thermaurantiacus sp.]
MDRSRPEPEPKPAPSPEPPTPVPEVGGREGPEPTRYGDWEVGGICTDF